MGLHIHTDNKNDTAILYCSTTNWAFGPVFDSPEQAEEFIKFCEELRPGVDLRKYEDCELRKAHLDFFRSRSARDLPRVMKILW